MGSGASKKKSAGATATVIAASLAFKRAGKRATKKNEEATSGNGELVQNGTSSSSPDNNNETTSKDPTQNVPVHLNSKDGSGDEPVSRIEKGGGCDQTSQHNDSNKQMVNGDNTTGRASDQNDEDKPAHDAIIKIQSVFRGHQDRQLLRRESEMAIKIQRRFRRHQSVQSITRSYAGIDGVEDKKTEEDDLEARKERREQRERAWLEDTPELLRKEDYMQVGQQTMEEFNSFQDEITRLKWKSEQQIERIVYGDTLSPRRILFISSNVPKSKQLTEASLEEVITFHYDFTEETFESLIAFLRPNLDAYKLGSNAKSICFVCQGAPGVLYLLKKRALTVQKLKKESEADQVRFWQSLGSYMSKIQSNESLIHVMGCNVMGSGRGQELFDELEVIAKPSILKIRAPLELSEEGNNMIATYFDVPKYETWKMRRFSKTE